MITKDESKRLVASFYIGDFLCDMHDGFQYLPKGFEVVSWHQWATENGPKAVAELTGKHSNKCLYLAGESSTTGHLFAVYSYDARYFGTVELKYHEENEA